MNIKSFAAVILAMATAAVPAARADTPPAPVWVEYSGDDTLGKDLVHLLREQITRSPLMRLSRDVAFCRAKVQTIDPSPDYDPGLQTVYSIVVVCGLADVFVTSSIGRCGARVLDECAVTLSRRLYDGVMQAVNE
mgnify:CR=1 FL=1